MTQVIRRVSLLPLVLSLAFMAMMMAPGKAAADAETYEVQVYVMPSAYQSRELLNRPYSDSDFVLISVMIDTNSTQKPIFVGIRPGFTSVLTYTAVGRTLDMTPEIRSYVDARRAEFCQLKPDCQTLEVGLTSPGVFVTIY